MAGDRDAGRPFEVQGYEHVTQIGRGASSHVYKAYDPELRRWVAIKVLLTDDPEDPARRRFKREGEITANLGKHPHIVQVLGTGISAADSPFVVMEYYEQGSIADRLRSAGTFRVDEALDIGEKIADAVSAAHRAGVLHRDIKPQNILLSEYGPALGDFGIARTSTNLEWSQSLDQLTPMHAAPEVLLGGTSTVQSDLYALGSTLYAMLSGRPPFAGPPGEAPLRYQVRVVQEPVQPIPRADVPETLAEVIDRALAKSPADRYHSAADFREALLSCRQQVGGVHRMQPPPASPGRTVPLTDAAPEPPASRTPESPRPRPSTTGGSTSEDTVNRSTSNALRASPEAHVRGDDDDAPTMVPSPMGRTSTEAPGRPPPDLSMDRAAPGQGDLLPQVDPGLSALAAPGEAFPAMADYGPADGERTIHRPISVIGVAPTPTAADGASSVRHRRVIVSAIAVGILALAGLGVLLLSGNSGPPKVPVKHEYTITTADTDKPDNIRLVPSGNGATLEWSTPTGATTEFLVYEVKPNQRPVTTVVPAGRTTLSLPDVDPSSTQECFEVRARINTKTVGAPAEWCPTGESISG